METSPLCSAHGALLSGTAADWGSLAPPVLLCPGSVVLSGLGTLGAQHLPTSSCLPPQVVYYSEMHKIFGDLTQQLDQPGHPDEQREQENEAKLSELRALSIVADD